MSSVLQFTQTYFDLPSLLIQTTYEDFPLVKSFFFNTGMEFLQQRLGVIYTKQGLLTITLGYTRPTAFTYKLTYGESMLDVVAGIKLLTICNLIDQLQLFSQS